MRRARVWTAHVLLGLGLVAPCLTVTPRLGQVDGLGRWLGLVDEPETYSVLTGILELLAGGNVALGIVLLFFSVVFPVGKLVVLRACLAEGRPGRAHAFVARFGRYSMADVFVLALMVVASKSFPGGTTVDIRWGAFAFAAAALLTVSITPSPSRNPLPTR
jgi:paraquat-inducible protein A